MNEVNQNQPNIVEQPNSDDVINFLKGLQNDIVDELLEVEGSKDNFRDDHWEQGGHYGRICVIQSGKVFEKAGCTHSIVKGELTEVRKAQLNSRGWSLPLNQDLTFLASGVSLVFHPNNPFAPTVHLNYRFFQVFDQDNKSLVWWFGGGSDLSPCYLFKEDAKHFHLLQKEALDQIDLDLYPKFKKTCDDYFYIPHRNEHRGIGGIFFDDITTQQVNPSLGLNLTMEQLLHLWKSCANAFIPAYFPILKRRFDSDFNDDNKLWQQIRRGRYVEFNLVYDRGTHFGLKVPNIRAENILVSLPLTCRWEFQHQPTKGSEEEVLLNELTNKPREWHLE